MPDMLAHYEVAEAARARLPQSPLARVLAAEHDAFKVGAQGPDFFFYSHAWPGQRSRGDLAFLVHQHRTSEVFRALLSAAAEASPRERPVICAFTCGYAAHVCLDADAHPWIQYWTGDITAGVDTPSGASARRRHGVLEASIDLTLSGRHSADPGWIRSRRLLDMPRYQRAVVASVWSRLMAEVHGVAYSAAEGRAAFRDMAFVYGSMTDRHSALSLVLAALAVGHGLLAPSLSSLTSRLVPSHEVGGVMGVSQGVSSLARIFGPFWAEWVYGASGPAAPYLSAAVAYAVSVVVIVAARRAATAGEPGV